MLTASYGLCQTVYEAQIAAAYTQYHISASHNTILYYYYYIDYLLSFLP